MARVVVIGAGAGGLAVAARLAAKRHDVTVLEQRDRVGGKLATVTYDGFSFDVGPSLFTLPAVYRDLFLKTGAPLEHEVGLLETEPGFRYEFANRSTLQLPGSSIGRTANSIGAQFGPTAHAEWSALMDHAAEVWRLSRGDVLGTPLESVGQFARLARNPTAIRTISPWRSLASLAGKRLSDRRLRQLLWRYATYSGSDPERSPSALVTIPFVEATFGLWHIRGGLGGLATAMAARARKAGATITLGAQAHRIHHVDDAVTGVSTTQGDLIPADVVISDMDTRWLPELLDRPVKQPAETSYSGFSLLLAIEGRSDQLSHHNVWFPGDYRQEFVDLRAGRPVRDPAIYVCRPDDDTMAPAGHEAWFVLANAPRHGSHRYDTFDWSDPAIATAYADHLIALLARRGLDVRDRIKWRQIQTPMDLGLRDGSRDGAIYGAAGHGLFSVLRRARNITDIAGLYVLGGTAHPGGGLPLVGMSAEFIAERIGRAK